MSSPIQNNKKPKTTSIRGVFNLLKNTVLGTETSKLDNFIDNSFDKIELYSEKINRNIYLDKIKNLLTNHQTSGKLDDVIKELQDASLNVKTLDTTNRISRYKEYEAIVSRISHCKRALQVLVTNIISPDNITKQSIDFVVDAEIATGNKDIEKKLLELDNIKKALKIEENITTLVSTTLMKGDQFIEIIHSPKAELANIIIADSTDDSPKKKIHLNEEEVVSRNSPKMTINLEGFKETYKDKLAIEEDGKEIFRINIPKNIIIEGLSEEVSQVVMEAEQDENKVSEDKFKSKFDNDKKGKGVELKDVFLVLHKPEYVVRLETERFRSCLGYLVFPKIDPRLLTNISPVQQMAQPFTHYTTSNPSLVMEPVDAICKKIIETLYKHFQQSDTPVFQNKDLQDTVMQYLATIQKEEDLKIRYVAPNMIEHYKIDSQKFYPYGESIFDSVLFECKMLMALKTAQTIKYLTYCSDKRIIGVEVGLPRQAKNIINKVKETMRKRKISLDSLGGIDTIPSQIMTFEDIYIPMIDGKKFIEFDSRQWGEPPQNDTENLKFIRDNIVSNLMVPPNHIGIEEGNVSRATLTSESIIFARTVIGYQKQFGTNHKSLFTKIYNLIHPDEIDPLRDIYPTFPPPKTAEYEHEMEYIEQFSRLADAYRQLGVPDEYLKIKYLPQVDWKKIDELTTKQKIDKSITPPDQNSMGGMGGMGGM